MDNITAFFLYLVFTMLSSGLVGYFTRRVNRFFKVTIWIATVFALLGGWAWILLVFYA